MSAIVIGFSLKVRWSYKQLLANPVFAHAYHSKYHPAPKGAGFFLGIGLEFNCGQNTQERMPPSFWGSSFWGSGWGLFAARTREKNAAELFPDTWRRARVEQTDALRARNSIIAILCRAGHDHPEREKPLSIAARHSLTIFHFILPLLNSFLP